MRFELLQNPKNEAATDFIKWMEKIRIEVESALTKVREAIKKFMDHHQMKETKYKKEDEVLLSQSNITTYRQMAKLQHR